MPIPELVAKATSSQWLWRAVCGIVFAATTLFLMPLGYLKVFNYFAPWDDEGFLLLSLRSLHAGERLYDQVYAQYGPLYYQAINGLFSLLRLPLTHDNGRLVSLGIWLAVSLVCGLVMIGLSHRLWLGCCIQLLVFKSLLFTIGFEPLHPGGLLCLLLALLAGTAMILPPLPRLALALQGVLLASLALIKINVGALAVLAVGLACVTAFPPLARHRPLVLGAAVAVTATPVALMAANLDQSWAQRYALLVTAGAFAVVLPLVRLGPDERLDGRLRWLAGGAAATAAVVLLVTLLRGTSPAGLLEGVILQPLRQANAFTVPPNLAPHSRKIALMALAVCLLVTLSPRDRQRHHLGPLGAGLLRLAAGGAIAYSVAGVFRFAPLGFLLTPLAWIAALRPQGLEDAPALAYARHLLPPLAVLQALHAYPVAGSQVQWGSFLLLLVAGICLFDSTRQLAGWVRRLGLQTSRWPVPWLAPLPGLLAIFLVGRAFLPTWRLEYAAYVSGVALRLPGASRLHLPVHQATSLTWLRREIRQHCTTFVTLPGLNSLYLWSEEEPPTSFNATSWMYLFGPEVQQRIVDRIRNVDNLCVIRNLGLLAGWQLGRDLPHGPLVDYISHGFTPLESRERYELLVRSSNSFVQP